MKPLNLSNQTLGTFLAIARDPRRKRHWKVECTLCGTVSSKHQDSIIKLTARCRCNDRRTVHGDAGRGKRDRLYTLWQNLRQRVRAQVYSYPLAADPQWQSYRTFRDDILSTIGRPPSDQHSLDRIDPLGAYQKANVRWEDDEGQANNRSNTRRYASAEYAVELTAHEWRQYIVRVTGDPSRWTREVVVSLLEHLKPEELVSAIHPARRTPAELASAQREALQRAHVAEEKRIDEEMDRSVPDGLNIARRPIAQNDPEADAFEELFSE